MHMRGVPFVQPRWGVPNRLPHLTRASRERHKVGDRLVEVKYELVVLVLAALVPGEIDGVPDQHHQLVDQADLDHRADDGEQRHHEQPAL